MLAAGRAGEGRGRWFADGWVNWKAVSLWTLCQSWCAKFLAYRGSRVWKLWIALSISGKALGDMYQGQLSGRGGGGNRPSPRSHEEREGQALRDSGQALRCSGQATPEADNRKWTRMHANIHHEEHEGHEADTNQAKAGAASQTPWAEMLVTATWEVRLVGLTRDDYTSRTGACKWCSGRRDRANGTDGGGKRRD